MIRIVLNEADFRDLVAGQIVRPTRTGGIVRGQDIEIILSDIGWNRMQKAIEAAKQRKAAE